MSLALAIQTAREQQSLTQAALADQAGVDVRSLKRLESGANTALKTVEAVCSVLNLSPTTGQALVPCNPRLSRKDIEALIKVRNGILPISSKNTEHRTSMSKYYISNIVITVIMLIINIINIHGMNPNNIALLRFESILLFFSSLFLTTFFEMISSFLEKNRRFLRNVFFYNLLLQMICGAVLWIFPTIFSVLAIPAWLSMIGVVVLGSRRMIQYRHQIMYDLQYELEDIIKQLSRPDPNLDALEQTLFGLIVEARSEGYVYFERSFQVLVWLIQDLRLGITKPHKMQPYFRIAGEMAQTITQSDQYAALVKARQGDKIEQKPLEVRRRKLYKKGIRHLNGLLRELQSNALPA